MALMGKKKPADVETDEDGRVIAVAIPREADTGKALQAVFAGGASVQVGPAGDLQGVPEPRKTRDQQETEAMAGALGMHYDQVGKCVTMPRSGGIEHRDERLFLIDETVAFEMLGLRAGLALLEEGNRHDRARLLARHGRLTDDEVTHLRWLATADNPFEAVKDGTEPITAEQARELAELIEDRPQTGRAKPSPAARHDAPLINL